MNYKKLQPGMLTEDGLIVSVNKPYSSKFYNGNAWIKFIPLNDAYYGACTRSTTLKDKYAELYKKGTKEYQECIQSMIKELIDCGADIETNIDLLMAYKQQQER